MNKKYLIAALSFPPEAGGVAEYTYNLSKLLDAKITVLSCAAKKIMYPGADSYPYLANLTVKRVPYLPLTPFLTKILLLIFAVRLQKKEKFDLIICNHPLIGFVGQFMKKVFKIEYAVIAHGWDVSDKVIPGQKLKNLLKDARSIIVVSRFTENSISEQFPEIDNIHIIPPVFSNELLGRAVDIEFKKKLGLENRRILLTVSRLDTNTARKGHDLVLMALPEIVKKHPDIVYIVVGNGPMRKKFVEFAKKLKVDNNIIFLDYSRDGIHNYYSMCDVFVMPARAAKESGPVEGFGIVYLEAALFGKPSVGGKSGGVSEAILDGKTGILVNPLNISEIAEAVIRLLDNPEYTRMLGENAKKRALEEFCAEKIGARIKRALALPGRNQPC